MPNVSGLRPIDQNTTTANGGRLPQRLQVQDGLRIGTSAPVAAPTDTYLRPGATQPDNTLTRLADSLSSLAPGLAEFGAVQQRQADQDAPGKAAQKLMGRTPDEQRALLQNDPELQNHVAQKVGHSLYGQGVAEYTLNEIRSAYSDGTFDRQGGNFDQFVNGYIRRDLDGNTDPSYAKAYTDRIMAGVDSLRGTQAKFLTEQKLQEQDNLIYGSIQAKIGEAVDKGQSPDQAAAAIRQTFSTIKTVANRPVAEQEGILVEQLGRMAETLKDDPQYAAKFKMIEGILTKSRGADQSGAHGATTAANQGLLDYIAKAEGGDYNVSWGNGKFLPGGVEQTLTGKTLKQILELGNYMRQQPESQNSSAMGRYQLTGSTIRDLMGRMGLTGDEAFTPAMQDAMAMRLIRDEGPAALNRWEALKTGGRMMEALGLLRQGNTGSGSLLDDAQLGGKAAKVLQVARNFYNDRQQTAHIDEQASLVHMAETADPSFAATLKQQTEVHPDWHSPAQVLSLTVRHQKAMDDQKAELLKQQQQQAVDNQKNRFIGTVGAQAAAAGTLYQIGDQEIIDKNGELATWDGKDAREAVIKDQQGRLDRKYAGRESDPQVQQSKFGEEVKLYATNLAVNDDWKRLLEAGPSAAGTPAAQGAAFSPALRASYDLYTRLQASAPQLLARHIDEKSQDFFEVARVAQQVLHWDEKQAFITAATATADPNWKASAPTMNRRELADRARSSVDSWWPSMLGGKNLGATVNGDMPVTEVIQGATVLNRALGIPMDAAVKEAGRRVASNYAVVNGNAIRVADRQVPGNFGELASRFIDGWYDQHKGELDVAGFDKSDITVFSQKGSPTWQLLFRGHPAAIEMPGAYFSIPDLAHEVNRMNAERQVKESARKAQVEQDLERRHEPWVQIGNPDSPFSVSVGPFPEARMPIGSKRDEYLQAQEKEGARTKYRRDQEETRKMLEDSGMPLPEDATGIVTAY